MILTFIYVYTSLTVFILIKTFNQSYLWMNEWRKLITRAAVEQIESEARLENAI